MGRITEELLRRKSEHNPETLAELEEIALHQLEIEKIELLSHYCRHLKILLLQCNLISKIEGLNRLKELEYVNLALNNITTIENLEGCESLNKLDLTANFIVDLRCVEKLRENILLRDLYMTGNPCTKFEGYRSFNLDTEEIEKSERLVALQNLPSIRADFQRWLDERGPDENSNYTPEKRKEMYEDMESKRNESNKPKPSPKFEELEPSNEESEEKKPFRQKNEGKWKYQFDEDDEYVYLDIAVGRFLSTSLIDADVQPTYVKIIIKGKVLQLLTPEEVRPDASKAERSQTTGHLLLTMPKLKVVARKKTQPAPVQKVEKSDEKPRKPEVLGEGSSSTVDYRNIVKHASDAPKIMPLGANGGVIRRQLPPQMEPSPDFVDDPDVPPLE